MPLDSILNFMTVEHTANGVNIEVVRRAREGDFAAFAELVRLCRRRVLGTISRLIARSEDVEDVGQEVFLRMHTSIGRLQTPEAFDVWLYRLTMHGAYDYLRKHPRRREVRMADLLDQQIDAAAESAAWQASRDERDRLRTIDFVDSLLSQLSASDRILIVLREVEGLNMEELSAVFGVSVGAVKLRLFRARNRLRRVLNPDLVRPLRPLAGNSDWAAQNV